MITSRSVSTSRWKASVFITDHYSIEIIWQGKIRRTNEPWNYLEPSGKFDVTCHGSRARAGALHARAQSKQTTWKLALSLILWSLLPRCVYKYWDFFTFYEERFSFCKELRNMRHNDGRIWNLVSDLNYWKMKNI